VQRDTKVTQAHLSATPDAIYPYANGLRKLRYGHGKGKRFVWQRQDDAGGWIDGRDGLEPGLYLTDTLATVDAFAPVWLIEGEKCAEALAAAGEVAISAPDGAGSWRDEYAGALYGRQVIVIADDDTDGAKHATSEVDGLLGVALSVRRIDALPGGAHDVADWLAEGHTAQELRHLAASTPIIIAPSLSAQNSRHAFQDAIPIFSGKPCPDCERERELREIAEKSLDALRKQHATEAKVLALPSETASAPTKAAAVVMARLLYEGRGRPRDEQGRQQFSRHEIGRALGVSPSSVSKALGKLSEARIISKVTPSAFGLSELYIGPGELISEPEHITPSPKRTNTWGGKRVRVCRHCLSEKLIPTAYVCQGCGSHLSDSETMEVDKDELVALRIEAEEKRAAESDAPIASPPEISIEARNRTHAENSGLPDEDEDEVIPAPHVHVFTKRNNRATVGICDCGETEQEYAYGLYN
jgi:hypothetical protein